jgi:nucleoside-diphosphate-sugar epimerase
MSSARLLVTGASGFTGQHVMLAAQKRGIASIAMVQDRSTRTAALGENEVVEGDLTDIDSLRQALSNAAPTHLIHLAAAAFVADDDVSAFYTTNQLGTLNLLTALTEVQPPLESVLIASSANIYGNATSLPITETFPVKPLNHYGVSKLAMELTSQLFTSLPIVTVRPFNYTGVGQDSKYLIPKLVNAFRQRDAELSLGNLDVARDFSDVRDVVEAYFRLLERPEAGATFNICSGRATSLHELVDILARHTGHRPRIISDPALIRDNEIKSLYGSPAKLEARIGDYRSYRIEDTLEWMLRA